MHYSYEYKLKCIELYKQGLWPEKPEGVTNEKNFHSLIRLWSRLEQSCGPEILKQKVHNKKRGPEDRYELVAKVLAGQSIKETAVSAGMHPGTLYQWVQKYKEMGYNGLEDIHKGRPPKESQMKKVTTNNSTLLTESEREELIRLRAEIEYIKSENEEIRAENEVIKKRIALRQEKEAARLKAKKQQSSKNSAKKDIN